MKMICVLVNLGLFMALAEAASPIVISDERGDAKFERGEPLAAFDLISVTFEGLPENQLKITFTGDGPMSDKGTTYSWFAVWLDLDVDTTTGDKFSDVGCDIILAAEAVRRSEEWTGEITAKSEVGREFPVKFVKIWPDGNSVHVIYQSDLFEKYPIFRAAAFAHHDGSFSDDMYGGRMNYIKAFDATATSVEAPDPFALKKVLAASYGKKRGHKIALTPRDRRISITVTPRKLNDGPKFDPKIEFSVTSEDSSCAHIRLIRRETSNVFESLIRTKLGGGSHCEIDLNGRYETNEPLLLEFQWDEDEANLMVNGETVGTVPISFPPVSASIFTYSTEALVEKLEVE